MNPPTPASSAQVAVIAINRRGDGHQLPPLVASRYRSSSCLVLVDELLLELGPDLVVDRLVVRPAAEIGDGQGDFRRSAVRPPWPGPARSPGRPAPRVTEPPPPSTGVKSQPLSSAHCDMIELRASSTLLKPDGRRRPCSPTSR